MIVVATGIRRCRIDLSLRQFLQARTAQVLSLVRATSAWFVARIPLVPVPSVAVSLFRWLEPLQVCSHYTPQQASISRNLAAPSAAPAAPVAAAPQAAQPAAANPATVPGKSSLKLCTPTRYLTFLAAQAAQPIANAAAANVVGATTSTADATDATTVATTG